MDIDMVFSEQDVSIWVTALPSSCWVPLWCVPSSMHVSRPHAWHVDEPLCTLCCALLCCHSTLNPDFACVNQVQFWAPAAAAAGVSLVMAYLNGVAIPDLLSLHTLIAKWVGTCCSVGANLTLGPEAPMVCLYHAHVSTHPFLHLISACEHLLEGLADCNVLPLFINAVFLTAEPFTCLVLLCTDPPWSLCGACVHACSLW